MRLTDFSYLCIAMNSKDQIATTILEQGLKKSLQDYETNSSGNTLSDLYLHYDERSHTLSIYDDMEAMLNEVSFEKKPERFSSLLRQMLQRFEKEKLFDKEYILKPFTISLVDEHFLITEELIFIDDDTMKLESDIWSDIEKELDDFLKKLLD